MLPLTQLINAAGMCFAVPEKGLEKASAYWKTYPSLVEG